MQVLQKWQRPSDYLILLPYLLDIEHCVYISIENLHGIWYKGGSSVVLLMVKLAKLIF